MSLRAAAGLLLALFVQPAAAAADTPVPSREMRALALATGDTIRLDGAFDEPVWQRAPLAGGFRQREPVEGANPSYETELRVVYSDTAMYVAVRAIDPDSAKLIGRLTRRDTQSSSDWIRVIVDSYHDRRTAFEFAVNPAGVKQDRYWFNDWNSDLAWDAVWDVGVETTATGWQAEFRIPFSQLRFDPKGDGTFGFAVVRYIARLDETTTWPLLPRNASGYVSTFGTVGGILPGRAPRRFEVVPYGVARLETDADTDTNPFGRQLDPGAAAGVDAKLALTPGLTLTTTVNPDFGQVEADPAVVNLTAFETFFPERRPFFLEGVGIFRLDLDCEDDNCSGLFYSRRIGRSPQIEPDAPDDGYSSAPGETTILGAAKLTGRVGQYSVGALNALTGRERVEVATAGGEVSVHTAEPFTSYSVGSGRREFANQSSIGALGTATNRSLPDDAQTLASQAYTGGLDVDWRLSPRYRLAGYLAGSTVHGSTEAMTALQETSRHYFQRPDADHVRLDDTRTSLSGHAGQLMANKNAGDRLRFNSIWSYKTPGFEANDLGFMVRADQRQLSNWLQIRRDEPTRWGRNVRVNVNQWHGWNFDGDRIQAGGNVNAHITLPNNWRTGAGVTYNAEAFDDRLTRGGPGGYRDPRVSLWQYSRDRRAAGRLGQQLRVHDARRLRIVDIRAQPGAECTSDVGGAARHRREVGPQPQSASVGGERGGWCQPALRLRRSRSENALDAPPPQLYDAPGAVAPVVRRAVRLERALFVVHGAFVDGRADFDHRYAPYDYGEQPDFRYTSLRTTNVLRWEYRPGSTLFVVWQQGREQEDDLARFQFGRDIRHVFSGPSANVLLVKIAYWFNF